MIRLGLRIILLFVLSRLTFSSSSLMLNEPSTSSDDGTPLTQTGSRRSGATMLRRGAINHNYSGPGSIRGLSEKSGKGGKGGKGKSRSDGKRGKGGKGKGKGKDSDSEDSSMTEHATVAPTDHTVVAEAVFPTPSPYTPYPTIEASTTAPTPVPFQEAVVLSQPPPPTPYPTSEPTAREPTFAPVQEALALSQPPPPTPTPYQTIKPTTRGPSLAPVQEAFALSQPPPPTPYPTIETYEPTHAPVEKAIALSQPFPPTLHPTVESCDGDLTNLETCMAINDHTLSFVSCERCVKKVAGLVFRGFDAPFCDLSPGSVCNNLVACRFSGCVDSCLVHAYEYGSCELRRVCGYDFFDAASCPTN